MLKAAKQFDINSEKDLEQLNHWVHCLRPYKQISISHSKEINLPFGNVWANYGAECRNFAGIMFAILTLKDRPAILLSNNKDKNRQAGHSFVETELQGLKYIADPTWDICVEKNKVIDILRKRNLTTVYHQDYSPSEIILNFPEKRIEILDTPVTKMRVRRIS